MFANNRAVSLFSIFASLWRVSVSASDGLTPHVGEKCKCQLERKIEGEDTEGRNSWLARTLP